MTPTPVCKVSAGALASGIPHRRCCPSLSQPWEPQLPPGWAAAEAECQESCMAGSAPAPLFLGGERQSGGVHCHPRQPGLWGLWIRGRGCSTGNARSRASAVQETCWGGACWGGAFPPLSGAECLLGAAIPPAATSPLSSFCSLMEPGGACATSWGARERGEGTAQSNILH